MSQISVLILTYNEEKHIARCIESLRVFTKAIYIVDSFSTDKTVEIATSLGAYVYQNPWTNYAVQYQWGLDHCPIETEWVMRMDADEYVLPELATEIAAKMAALPEDVSGIYLKRRVYFMDRWIKHGSFYPLWLLRIWRYKLGKIEQRWMDEHIVLSEGKTVNFEHDLVDENLNDLTWWTQKHNNYATREAVDLLNNKYGFLQNSEMTSKLFGAQDKNKRWFKQQYEKIPFFVRPFMYFIWRYFFKLGFLDGRQGLVWHFLQGFWYRFLADAKAYEVERRAKKSGRNIKEVLGQDYGFKF